jgi:hypothetical protein
MGTAGISSLVPCGLELGLGTTLPTSSMFNATQAHVVCMFIRFGREDRAGYTVVDSADAGSLQPSLRCSIQEDSDGKPVRIAFVTTHDLVRRLATCALGPASKWTVRALSKKCVSYVEEFL